MSPPVCIYFSSPDAPCNLISKAPHLIQRHLLTRVHLLMKVLTTVMYIIHIICNLPFNMSAKYRVMLLKTSSNLQCLTYAMRKVISNGNPWWAISTTHLKSDHKTNGKQSCLSSLKLRKTKTHFNMSIYL